MVESPRILATAELILLDRRVRLDFRRTDQPYPAKILRADQEYLMGYWPTSACWLDEKRLVVGGTAHGDRTVLELWRFHPPHLLYDAPTGRDVLASGVRLEVRPLYKQALPGRTHVSAMTKQRGTGLDSILVMFFDSKEVVSYDLATGTMALQASPTDLVAPVVEPCLNEKDWKIINFREHLDEGYFYFLSTGGCIVTGPTVVLIDGDRDGRLDRSAVLSDEEWKRGNYHDQRNWIHERW